MKQRGRPRHKAKPEPQVFCGLLKCGTCNMMITAELKVKRQKNGNVHYYTYYRCTRKSKSIKCAAPFIRQEELDKQISSLLQKVSLPTDWAEKLNTRLEKTNQNPPNPFLLLFKRIKRESKLLLRNSSDFLTAIWNRILTAKFTEPRKQIY